MRRWSGTLLAGAVGLTIALHPLPAAAQVGFDTGRVDGERPSPILTLDSERLLNDSAAGRAIDQDLADASAALAAENRRIEADLSAEEQDLSTRRASLTIEEFRAEAAAFNEKVERFRTEQDAKLRELQQKSDEARLTILQSANPVLASIMNDTGAMVILEKGSVIVAHQTIDVTDMAIERLDAAMADASGAGDAIPPGTDRSTPQGQGSDDPEQAPATQDN